MEQQATEKSAETTVLVIDDDTRNVFAVSSYLESEGMDVVSEESGPAGLKRLQESKDIDVVLMDIKMPGMDGYEAMREIRKVPHLQSVPIIAVTGKASDEEHQRCVEAGASDYIPKPIDVDRLMEMIEELVR